MSKKNCRKTFLASSSEKCNLNTKIELWRIAQKGFITPVVANTRVKVRKAPSSTGAATEAWREVTVRADVGKGGAYWKILDDGWYDVQVGVGIRMSYETEKNRIKPGFRRKIKHTKP